MKNDLLTLRQYMFLHWLDKRTKQGVYCDTSGTDIQCFNCLDRNSQCAAGLIPASYFSKKIRRQYYDCKRVLESLKKKKFINELEIPGKIFHVFYRIEPKGQEFLHNFEEKHWIS